MRSTVGMHIFGCGDKCEGCYPKFTRFSDAELAAELHRQAADVYRAKVHGLSPDGLIDRFMILTRFAKLPNFDEVDC